MGQEKVKITLDGRTQFLSISRNGGKSFDGIVANDATLRLIAEAIKAHLGTEAETQTVPASGCPYCESKYYAGMPGMCQCVEEAENG